MEERSRVAVSGPLASYASGFVDWLALSGYRPVTRVEHLRRLSLLSGWLERDGVDLAALDESLIGRLFDGHRREGRDRWLTSGAFWPLLEFLRSAGAVPAPMPVSTPVGLLDGYREYLVVERGLRSSTIQTYMWNARRFMSTACDDDPGRVGSLTAADVAAFVIDVAEHWRASSVNMAVVGVRSLLRYFYAAGLIDKPLAQATPWLARGRASSLPRTVAAGTAELLMASFDRTSLVGARDFAIFTMFARLGLRVGEVTEMRLDDIDWRRGELVVRSKGGWRDPLPLPVDVGDALAAYVSMRGRDEDWRQVFMCIRAPRRPMTATGLKAMMRRACARVGVGDLCTHWLRHSVAVDLLRHGAALPEIGQVLRHRDLATTAVYAKVDYAALASVAQPWPASAS